MAYENVPVTAGSGTNIVCDQTASGYIQVVKIDIGTDGNESQLSGSFPINDNGGSVTVDGTVAVTDGAGTLTVDAPVGTPVFVRLSDGSAPITALPVTDNGGNLSIDDGGNSITVDGTVAATQSGTWTARLADGAGNALTSKAPGSERALSVAIVDGSGNQITAFTGSGGTSMSDDAAFTPGSTAVTPIAGVHRTSLDSVDNNDGGALAMTANRSLHTSLRRESDGAEWGIAAAAPVSVRISDGSAFPTPGQDYTHDAALTASTTAGPINPLRASLNEPTAVSASDDAVLPWGDLHGRQVVLTGHSNPESPVTVNATASGDTTVIAAPGASVSIHVCKGSIHNRDASAVVATLQDGAGGTARWRAELAPEGGGSTFDFGSRGWKLTANTLLNVSLSGAGSVDVNITEYYLAP